MKLIPNLFTLLNLFFGCMAIVYATQSGLMPMYDVSGMPLTNYAGNQFINIPEKIWLASVFILIAALVDFLDGFVARLLKATSELGKQLDSLADVVSFGVAPSIIIYQFLRLCYAQQENGLDTSIFFLLPAFIYPCAAAYRLGRFNLDPEQATVFKGLPVPAAGIVIASFPFIYWFSGETWILNLVLNKWFWYVLIILLSWLMVSKLKLMSLKFQSFSFQKNIDKWILLVIAVIAAITVKWVAIPVTVAAYIIVSLLFKNKQA